LGGNCQSWKQCNDSSFTPPIGSSINTNGLTLGLTIDPDASLFAHGEIDGTRLLWFENSNGGNDAAP